MGTSKKRVVDTAFVTTNVPLVFTAISFVVVYYKHTDASALAIPICVTRT